MKISVETTISAPLARVWDTYTSADDILQWNTPSADWHTTAARLDLRENGEFCSHMEAKDGSVGFDFSGSFKKIIKHHLIEYTFGDREARVEFSDKPDGIGLSVTFDREEIHSIEQQREGWQNILNNFKKHVEAGNR